MKLSGKYKYVIYLRFEYNNLYPGITARVQSGIIIFVNYHNTDDDQLYYLILKNKIGIHKKLSRKVIYSILKKSGSATFSLNNFLSSILSIRDEDVPITILRKEKR